MTISKKEEAYQKKRAVKQVRKKIKLERKFKKDINAFLNRQNRRFEAAIEMGLSYNAVEDLPELEKILRKHYSKTALVFTKYAIEDLNRSLRKAMQDRKVDASPSQEEINAALLLFIIQTTRASARQITKTSNKIAGRYIAEYQADTQGVTTDSNFDDAAMAAFVGEKLMGRKQGRSHSIAITETQKASEGSKATTAQTAAAAMNASMGNVIVERGVRDRRIAVAGAAAVLIRVIKTWRTVGDSKVRPDHVNANRQEQNIDEPYVVGGDLLMYPGDMSLGADIENVVNCRCSSIQGFSV